MWTKATALFDGNVLLLNLSQTRTMMRVPDEGMPSRYEPRTIVSANDEEVLQVLETPHEILGRHG
jgi:hypothetical protein